jgi:hypothetical protein
VDGLLLDVEVVLVLLTAAAVGASLVAVAGGGVCVCVDAGGGACLPVETVVGLGGCWCLRPVLLVIAVSGLAAVELICVWLSARRA